MTPPPTDGATYRFLSDVIIARGLVGPREMKAALQASLAGRSLTEILIDNGDLGEDDLARTLAEHHRLDFVNLDEFAVDHEVAALIQPDVAARFGAVPIARLQSGTVVVALHDPNGSTAALEFARLTGHPIQPAVASRSQIKSLIASLRRDGTPSRAADVPDHGARPPGAGGTTTVAPGGDRADYPRAGPPAAPHVDVVARELEAMRSRLADAEHRRDEAQELARTAEELTRLAEARARASEERALVAGERVEAAAARGAGMSSAADAANDTLVRLVHACEVLERESASRGPEIQALRIALEAERSQRIQLDMQLRYAAPPEQLRSLQARVAELERRLGAGLAEDTFETAAEPARVEVAEATPEEIAEATPEEIAEAAPDDLTAEVVAPAPQDLTADFVEPVSEDVAGADGSALGILTPPAEGAPKARRRRGLFGRRRRGA